MKITSFRHGVAKVQTRAALDYGGLMSHPFVRRIEDSMAWGRAHTTITLDFPVAVSRGYLEQVVQDLERFVRKELPE